MSTCIAEPISHLRLERHALRELPSAESERIEQHLQACSACSECFAELRANQITLPPLPIAAPKPGTRSGARVFSLQRFATLGSGLALAAGMLLGVRAMLASPELPNVDPPMDEVVKGSDVGLGLVRERDGDIARDAYTYRSGDRFQALLTCPPGAPTHWDLMVVQDDQVFFPLEPRERIACGNRVSVPGAFSLTGSTAATICIALDEAAAIDRKQLAASKSFPARGACVFVVPTAQ